MTSPIRREATVFNFASTTLLSWTMFDWRQPPAILGTVSCWDGSTCRSKRQPCVGLQPLSLLLLDWWWRLMWYQGRDGVCYIVLLCWFLKCCLLTWLKWQHGSLHSRREHYAASFHVEHELSSFEYTRGRHDICSYALSWATTCLSFKVLLLGQRAWTQNSLWKRRWKRNWQIILYFPHYCSMLVSRATAMFVAAKVRHLRIPY
jgi:hypothetical protein